MNVPDSVKNKLARSYVLHNYWSPLKILVEEQKRDQHQEQLNAMRESNASEMKAANSEMIETAKNMQIMMAAMPGMNKTSEEDNKKTDTQIRGVKPWDKPSYVKRDPKTYPNCKRVVYHKSDKCLELEANKEKMRDNWKSLL